MLDGDAITATHSATTGIFENNTANNIQSMYVHDAGYRDRLWIFVAIKL